jgi:alpha-beta hydrolase superfamily lysophospholipase
MSVVVLREYMAHNDERAADAVSRRSLGVSMTVLLWLLVALGCLLALGVAAGLGMTVYAYRAATHPQHGVFDAPRTGDHLPRESIALVSKDGTSLAAWFIAGTRAQAVLLLHGYTACKDDMLSHAAFLNAAGYSVMLLDLRACGESGGAAVTLGGHERDDVHAALIYLQSRLDVDPTHIGVLGLSLGGALAILSAADVPAVRAVVAESAFRSVRSAVHQNFRRFTHLPSFPWADLTTRLAEWRHHVRAARVMPELEVARLRRCALLLIHATDDEVISIRDSEAIFARAVEPKAFWRVASAPHAMAYNLFREEYAARVVAFFDQWLTPTAG